MRAFSDMNTRRLEDVAHKVGVDCQIKAVEAQEDGRFFVFAVDGCPLKQPVPLGFTVDRAVHSLNSGTWERYALRGEPTQLGSDGSRPSGPRPTGRGNPVRQRQYAGW